jgi:hypothetical protein
MSIYNSGQTMKKTEFVASVLTLVALWFVSEQSYTVGFALSTICCGIWVYWCMAEKHFYLLALEAFMGILYLKSFLGVI